MTSFTWIDFSQSKPCPPETMSALRKFVSDNRLSPVPSPEQFAAERKAQRAQQITRARELLLRAKLANEKPPHIPDYFHLLTDQALIARDNNGQIIGMARLLSHGLTEPRDIEDTDPNSGLKTLCIANLFSLPVAEHKGTDYELLAKCIQLAKQGGYEELYSYSSEIVDIHKSSPETLGFKVEKRLEERKWLTLYDDIYRIPSPDLVWISFDPLPTKKELRLDPTTPSWRKALRAIFAKFQRA